MGFDLTQSSAFTIFCQHISWGLLQLSKWWLKNWQELSIKMTGRYQPEESTLNVFLFFLTKNIENMLTWKKVSHSIQISIFVTLEEISSAFIEVINYINVNCVYFKVRHLQYFLLWHQRYPTLSHL